MIRWGATHGRFGTKLLGAVERPSVLRLLGDMQPFSAVNGLIRRKASARPLVADYDERIILNHGTDHKGIEQNELFQRNKPHVDIRDREFRNPIQVEEKPVTPATVTFTGDTVLPITSRLHIVEPGDELPHPKWPVFRLMVGPLATVHILLSKKYEILRVE